MTIARAARETAASPSAGSAREVKSWLRKWIIFHAADRNVLAWPLLMHFTTVLQAKSPAMGQAKQNRLERGATGNRKISPDAYCGPEVSCSGIIIAGREVWCAWQLLFPSTCMGWMGEPERQIHAGHCLQPPMGLSRMVVVWIICLTSQWDSLSWFFVPLHKRSTIYCWRISHKGFTAPRITGQNRFFFLICLFCFTQPIIQSFSVLFKNLDKRQWTASRLGCSWLCTSAESMYVSVVTIKQLASNDKNFTPVKLTNRLQFVSHQGATNFLGPPQHQGRQSPSSGQHQHM